MRKVRRAMKRSERILYRQGLFLAKNETIPGKTAKLLSLYSKSLLVPTPPHQKPLYLYRPFTISRMKERGGKGNSIPFPSAINTEAASEKRRRKGGSQSGKNTTSKDDLLRTLPPLSTPSRPLNFYRTLRLSQIPRIFHPPPTAAAP